MNTTLATRLRLAADVLPTAATLGTSRMRGSATGTPELLLYGVIGDEVTAMGVTQALASVPGAPRLSIRICSIGGSTSDGFAIFNALSRHPAREKVVTIEGMAASMASLIAMAGTEIVMPSNSYMMIHDPAALAVGGAERMQRIGEHLGHLRDVAAQTYASRSGQTVARVREIMAAETYLSAEQALALGFCDRIEAPMQVSASLDLSRLSSMPAEIRAVLETGAQSARTSTTINVAAIYARMRDPSGSRAHAARPSTSTNGTLGPIHRKGGCDVLHRGGLRARQHAQDTGAGGLAQARRVLAGQDGGVPGLALSLFATALHAQTYLWTVGALRDGTIPHADRQTIRHHLDLLRRTLRERMRLMNLLPADAPPLGALRLDRLDADIAELCGVAVPGMGLNAPPAPLAHIEPPSPPSGGAPG